MVGEKKSGASKSGASKSVIRPFDFYIETKEDLKKAVSEFGFVPLFENAIRGFSVEEHVSKKVWFTSEEGVWEWKGPVIRECGCAYGKFMEHKAVFISAEWFPDFANYRRDGYDFDALYDDELASYREKELYDLLEREAPVLSRRLKALGNYKKGGKKGFDTLIGRLQAKGYVLISDFVYEKDKSGHAYGWGVAEYSTPERFFGETFTKKVYEKSPEESYRKIMKHLKALLPHAEEEEIRRILG